MAENVLECNPREVAIKDLLCCGSFYNIYSGLLRNLSGIGPETEVVIKKNKGEFIAVLAFFGGGCGVSQSWFSLLTCILLDLLGMLLLVLRVVSFTYGCISTVLKKRQPVITCYCAGEAPPIELSLLMMEIKALKAVGSHPNLVYLIAHCTHQSKL